MNSAGAAKRIVMEFRLMAEISAFRGFRYDLGRVGQLSDVVAPPYDVIDPALQQKLHEKSPHNAIRLELAKDEAGDTAAENKYARAARTLKAWIAEDAVRQDTARALYAYEQEFVVDGKTFTRRGFFTRVRLEPLETGQIFAHEETMSGPKADRLKLYHATGFNLSPIFSFYPDAAGEVYGVLEPFTRKGPPLVAVDHLGVVSRLWVITDTQAISAVTGLMGPRPIFIADGHHRYETAIKYRSEQKDLDPDAPANFTLMMLVGMNDPGLVIQPTHRLVNGLSNVTTKQVEDVVKGHFQIADRFANAQLCWEHIQMDGSQGALGFGTADGNWFVAKLRNPAVMTTLVPDHSPEWRELGVSILHKLVLERLVPDKLGGASTLKFVHQVKEASQALAANECQLAILVPPATMSHVQTIAGKREKMPQKSTYFYPKVLTGLVFNSLKKD
jgi:uncharacterized protein (DUF1015 family)